MADYDIEDLYERGVDALAEETPSIGTTYEIAPETVGTLGPPVLLTRKKFIGLQQDLFQPAEGVDLEKLRDEIEEEDPEELDVEEVAGRMREAFGDEVSLADVGLDNTEVRCKQALCVLDLEEEADPDQVYPGMAQVVRAHFTRLRPGTNGTPETS